MPEDLETLASYLPTLLRRQLSANPLPLNKPRVDSFPVTLLFGDITGFTPLTVRLAQKGAEGVEELSRLLNSYFDRLIDIITSHGGDILKFAGDAVLVIWPIEGSPGDSVLRAAQCAMSIQAELHNFETFEGARLAMRIGLGSGTLTLAQLGGILDHWETIVLGSPIPQANLSEGRCRPGQVIISPEAWALAQDALQVELVEKEGKQALRLLAIHRPLTQVPSLNIPLTAEAENAARAYIPEAVLRRLASGQMAFLSELRPLTVIFVNLPGFDRLDNLDHAQKLVQTIQRALHRYEGSLNQFQVDDKGTTAVAVVGLPPFAHEDNPVRGILAALEIEAGLTALGCRFAIGVTTGQVFCGERGNEIRREYALFGDSVNTSARLMQAVLNSGENDILCDLVTWQAACARIDFETLLPLKVKGKTEPVPIYRPQREKSSALHTSIELVGRETEKDFISDALQALLHGKTQGPLVIEGEAGLGKSRLVEEAKHQAEASGLTFLCGSGDAIERTTAYHAWRNIVRQGFNLSATDSFEEQRAKVEAALPDRWRPYAPLWNALLPLNFRETSATSILRPQSRLDKTREMLDDVFRDLCTRVPTVLVLEDAQWFDTASWISLTAACRLGRQTPLLVILTARPLTKPYPPEYIHLLEEPGCRPLRLSPLDKAEIASLISQRLRIPRIGTALREFVQQRAEGNPFFVGEILLALQQAGALVETPGSCDLKPGTPQENIGLPDTLQGLIANRIDRLKPAEQMTIKVASVLGPIFDAGMVRAIYPIEAGRAEIDQNLRTLQEYDFIDLTSPGSYAFKHALIRQAIYNQMLFAQRRQLHRAVAEWVEKTNADNPEPHYALLAHHWRHTFSNPQDDPILTAKALDYLEKAGEQAAARLTYQEAAEFFSRALSLADKLPADLAHLVPKLRRMRWLASLGIAQSNQGHTGEARQALEQVARLGGYPIPETKTGLYLAILREAIIQAWHRLRPTFLRPHLSAEREQQDSLIAETQVWLFQPYFFNNQFLEGVLSTLKATNISENLSAQSSTLSSALSIAYISLSWFVSLFGLKSIESAYERLARKIPVTSREPTLQSGLDTMLAARFIGEGQWERVKFHIENALALLESQPAAHHARGTTITQMCMMYYYQGRYADHLDNAEVVGQIGRISNNVEFKAWHMTGWAMDHSLMGNFKALQIDVDKLERLLPDIPGSGMTQTFLPTYRGRLAVALQNWELAETCATQLEQMLSASSFSWYIHLDCLTICAEVPLAQWRCADRSTAPEKIRRWRESAKRACRALWQFAWFYPLGKPAAYRYQGYYDWREGKPEKAHRNWQASLEAAQKVAMPHEEALAHWALAQLPSPEQTAHRQQTREILERLGAAAYFDYLESQS